METIISGLIIYALFLAMGIGLVGGFCKNYTDEEIGKIVDKRYARFKKMSDAASARVAASRHK